MGRQTQRRSRSIAIVLYFGNQSCASRIQRSGTRSISARFGSGSLSRDARLDLIQRAHQPSIKAATRLSLFAFSQLFPASEGNFARKTRDFVRGGLRTTRVHKRLSRKSSLKPPFTSTNNLLKRLRALNRRIRPEAVQSEALLRCIGRTAPEAVLISRAVCDPLL
jgi:hypothetical protein